MNTNLHDLKALNMGLLRNARDGRLSDADNLVNTALDKGVDATPFRQYRQALRDITQTFSDTENVIWPIKPLLPSVSV